jgi:hypothetical protein
VDRSDTDDALARLFEVAHGLIEVIEQAVARGDGVDLASLKSQCFDLMFEAIVAAAQRRAADPASAALVARFAAFQRSFADVRLHLIELTEDWHCAVCGRDVARGIEVVSKSPFTATVVCRNCGAKTSLNDRGNQRLHELFDPVVSAGWNPALNGFLV